MKNKRFAAPGTGAFLSLTSAVIGVVGTIGYCVYGVVYDYFDSGVCIGMLIACALAADYGLLRGKGVGALNLLASVVMSASMALFFLNSFPVWADNLTGITMYASRGGLVPVVILMVMMLAVIVLNMISCFKNTCEEETK